MASLYELTSEALAFQQHVEELIEMGAIDDPAVAEAIDEHLLSNAEQLKSKADDYAALIAECRARSAARKAEAERMTKLAKADDALADKLAERLKMAFETLGVTKLETPRFKLGIVGNGGKQKLITPDELDPNALPIEFQKRIPAQLVANTDAIREALEAGESVDGFALAPRGTRLKIS